MKLPKFVITMDGYFRLGMVDQHKHLLKLGDQCIGGGYYTFDFVSNRIILDRESYDFGRPKWHLLDVLKVPSIKSAANIQNYSLISFQVEGALVGGFADEMELLASGVCRDTDSSHVTLCTIDGELSRANLRLLPP